MGCHGRRGCDSESGSRSASCSISRTAIAAAACARPPVFRDCEQFTLNAAAFAPEALPPSLKLRRTAGVPNAAAALGWPAVALAEAGRRASPELGKEPRRAEAGARRARGEILENFFSAVSALNVICSDS